MRESEFKISLQRKECPSLDSKWQCQLDYHSTQAKRTKLPIEVKSALSKIGEIEYQDCYLNNLDQFGIGYKLVYFLADRDFVKHLQIRQSVTEQLLEVIQGLDLVLIGKSFSVDQ